jgi:SP family general alpha glucoside:H+ symporter-like MFS transporter
MAWLITFCFPYMLNPDAGNLQGKVGFVFGGLTLVALLLCFLLLPETKGRTTEEVDLLYEKKTKPWNFAKTNVSILEG